MRKQLFTAAVVLFGLSGTGHADEAMDRQFNEEAIQRYLQETGPDVAYLVRLKMMKGHLKAAKFMLQAGDSSEAVTHVSHPMEEILPDLAPALAARNVDLKPVLEKSIAAAASGNEADVVSSIDQSLVLISEAEQLALKAGSEKLAPDVIAILLRTAVVEYHEAFEGTRLKNPVEYHDGAFFVNEARAMLADMEPSLRAKNEGAFTKMTETLEKLYKAWPETTPPQKLVLPVTKMQSLVTLAEIQLNKLR
jgi:hypothetical protein